MPDVVLIVLPVFSLIAVGTAMGLLGWLSPQAEKGIAEFAFTLAIPALLFRTIAIADFSALSIGSVWISFFAGASLVWLLATLATRWLLGRPAADAPSIAMSAVFGNTVMLGLPISLATYGEAAAAPVALVLSIHAATFWLAATLHAHIVAGRPHPRSPSAGIDDGLTDGELTPESLGHQSGPGIQPHASLIAAARGILADLVRNPIIIGILLGALWRLTGQPLPVALSETLALLAQAGVPAALTALGLSLVRFQIRGQAPSLALILALKLAAMPLAVWLLATQVFALSNVTAGVLVILAAVPTGANAYLFASRQRRAVNSASGAVALGTLSAAVTIPLLLSVLPR